MSNCTALVSRVWTPDTRAPDRDVSGACAASRFRLKLEVAAVRRSLLKCALVAYGDPLLSRKSKEDPGFQPALWPAVSELGREGVPRRGFYCSGVMLHTSLGMTIICS